MRICSIENCTNKYRANGFCSRHYQQFKTHGKIITTSQRTKRDSNEIINENDYIKIKLYNDKCIETGEAICDSIYRSEIEKFKWYIHSTRYVATTLFVNSKKCIGFLHQFIIQLSDQKVPDKYEIDHKDGDPLNNRKNNLRICTHLENTHNKKLNKNNVSGYKGVTWHKLYKKWQASITVNNKNIYLGKFNKIEDAINAYNVAAIQHFGEFAQLNVI